MGVGREGGVVRWACCGCVVDAEVPRVLNWYVGGSSAGVPRCLQLNACGWLLGSGVGLPTYLCTVGYLGGLDAKVDVTSLPPGPPPTAHQRKLLSFLKTIHHQARQDIPHSTALFPPHFLPLITCRFSFDYFGKI